MLCSLPLIPEARLEYVFARESRIIYVVIGVIVIIEISWMVHTLRLAKVYLSGWILTDRLDEDGGSDR